MRYKAQSSLIPTRFMTLTTHFVLLIIVLCSREDNILACMPMDFTHEQYEVKDTQLVIDLATAVGLIIVEMIGFLSGYTMFITSVLTLSSVCHALGSILLSLAVLDQWDCNIFWWIFVICSVIPTLTELTVIFIMITLKRYR